MTTEQQARELLAQECEVMGGEETARILRVGRSDFVTCCAIQAIGKLIAQAAEDKVKLELYSSLASKYEELRALIDNGHESYTHEDAVFRVTEDRRIADAVRRHGVRTYAGRVYDCNLGHDGALIEETLPESMIGNVLILPSDAVGGG